MRFEEQSEVIWEEFPSEYLDIAVFVTDLGDVTAIILLLSVLFWVSDRKKAALVASFTVAGISVMLLLKTALAMPRPEVEIVARTYDPYGFPSAHAFISVIVYGGLVYVFERYREPVLVVAVGLLIAAISLSRVVLGVHYLGDIIAGAVLGIVFLPFMYRLTGAVPRRGFTIGVLLAVPAAAITSGEATMLALVGLGAGVGGLFATIRLDAVPALQTRREGIILVVLGVGWLVGISILESALAGESPVLVAGFHAVLVGGVFLLPVVSNYLETRMG